ncbi:MAG: membrane-associated phospholipid phosphatase [Dinoroseobacter sp.]|jgi:membrane-associated phospholipid phosphatase
MRDFLRVPRLQVAWRLRIIGLVLIAVIALSPQDQDGKGIGSNLQIALPLLAWGCEAMNGRGPEYLARYVVMFVGLHATKQALGDAEINRRPNGGLEGFPSGHTSTAVFGASSLAQSCLVGHPVAQGAVILAAAFTGTSRVASGWHDIWQTLAGALWGWAAAQAFRGNGPVRRWIKLLFRRA